MRLFVAVEVPGAAGAPAAPAHLTLRFLGEVGPERVGGISERLTAVARDHPPFEIRIEGVGAFPNRRAPRIVYVGVTQGATRLGTLAEAVRAVLRDEGEPERDRAFLPHLTLLRVRSADDRRAAARLLEDPNAAPPPRDVRVDRLLLKASELRPGGAVHRTVADVPLGAGDGGAR